MGQKLIDVLNLKDEGLTGFTEIGEEIKLSGPIPNIYFEGEEFKKYSLEKKMEIISKLAGDYAYIKFETNNDSNLSLDYKIYKKRE
ncbi:MAG: hypothetical protein ACP5OG_01065 [Candidatus Nanoarchaeia archaeon]